MTRVRDSIVWQNSGLCRLRSPLQPKQAVDLPALLLLLLLSE
jgi:hypothetical protein